MEEKRVLKRKCGYDIVANRRKVMGEVIGVGKLQEKGAKKRQTAEMHWLHEVNSRINHSPQLRVQAGMSHSKTLHHGVDLCSVLAKYDDLAIVKKMHPHRFIFAISEGVIMSPDMVPDPSRDGKRESLIRQAVLLVHMPDKWYVLSTDDFVYGMDEYHFKIIETAEKVGLWKVVEN